MRPDDQVQQVGRFLPPATTANSFWYAPTPEEGPTDQCTNHQVCDICDTCHSCFGQWHHNEEPGEGLVDEDVLDLSIVGTQQSDQEFDTMVQRASVVNLASLFKQGVKTGVIAPEAHYS